MDRIQMVDLTSQYERIKLEINNAIQDAIDSSAFINGPFVKEFAAELAIYLNAKKVIPCGNGTDALQIALMALDLKSGDEVIVPVHTYVATAEVAALLGLKLIFAEVNPDTFTLDPESLKNVITPKSKAIVPVHLYGQCCDMDAIMKIAKEHHLYVIEDTAQALGSEYIDSNNERKKAGTIGHIGTTSFFPSKNLGCFGDGGAIVSNDEALAEKCRVIASHGQTKKYVHDVIGCNSRLDTLQAAILKAKLPHLNDFNAARTEVASKYDKAFESSNKIQTPLKVPYSTHVYHQYTIKLASKRDEIKSKLSELGIPSMIYYPIPLHLQKAYYSDKTPEGSFPITEKLSKTVLSLPIHTEMKNEQQDYIIEQVLRTVEEIQ